MALLVKFSSIIGRVLDLKDLLFILQSKGSVLSGHTGSKKAFSSVKYEDVYDSTVMQTANVQFIPSRTRLFGLLCFLENEFPLVDGFDG